MKRSIQPLTIEAECYLENIYEKYVIKCTKMLQYLNLVRHFLMTNY